MGSPSSCRSHRDALLVASTLQHRAKVYCGKMSSVHVADNVRFIWQAAGFGLSVPSAS